MGAYDIYASPNITDENGILGLFQYVNSVSDGIFFSIFLGVIWIVTFIIGARISSPAKSLVFSSFIGMILAMILATLGFINPKSMYLLILGLAIGLFWLKQENS